MIATCALGVSCIILEILLWENYTSCWGGSFEELSTLDNFNSTGFILGCENWDSYS